MFPSLGPHSFCLKCLEENQTLPTGTQINSSKTKVDGQIKKATSPEQGVFFIAPNQTTECIVQPKKRHDLDLPQHTARTGICVLHRRIASFRGCCHSFASPVEFYQEVTSVLRVNASAVGRFHLIIPCSKNQQSPPFRLLLHQKNLSSEQTVRLGKLKINTGFQNVCRGD